MRNTCVGTSEGSFGGFQGNVYEHVPLTTLRLSPIYRANLERTEGATPRSMRHPVHQPANPPTRLSPRGVPQFVEGSTLAATWFSSPPAAAVVADMTGVSAVPAPPHQQGPSSGSGEAATLQDSPQQQTFMHSHLMSAEVPEDVVVSGSPESSQHTALPVEGNKAFSLPASLHAEVAAGEIGKTAAQIPKAKFQPSFANDPYLSLEPPDPSSSASAVLNTTDYVTENTTEVTRLPRSPEGTETEAVATTELSAAVADLDVPSAAPTALPEPAASGQNSPVKEISIAGRRFAQARRFSVQC